MKSLTPLLTLNVILTAQAITSLLNNPGKSLGQLHFVNLQFSQHTNKAALKCQVYSLFLRKTTFGRLVNPVSGRIRMETENFEGSPSAMGLQPAFLQLTIMV